MQVVSVDGATGENEYWCARFTTFDQPVVIPWSDFNTACWDGSGTTYGMQPLASVTVYVPGDNVAARPFDFCINDVAVQTSAD